LTESLFTPTSSEKNLIAIKWQDIFDSVTETDMELIVQSSGIYFIILSKVWAICSSNLKMNYLFRWIQIHFYFTKSFLNAVKMQNQITFKFSDNNCDSKKPDDVIECHRAIIASRCPWFRRALLAGMKESRERWEKFWAQSYKTFRRLFSRLSLLIWLS